MPTLPVGTQKLESVLSKVKQDWKEREQQWGRTGDAGGERGWQGKKGVVNICLLIPLLPPQHNALSMQMRQAQI